MVTPRFTYSMRCQRTARRRRTRVQEGVERWREVERRFRAVRAGSLKFDVPERVATRPRVRRCGAVRLCRGGPNSSMMWS